MTTWKTDPSPSGHRAVASPPPSVVIDRGDKHYRGGQVRAIVADVATLMLYLEGCLIGELTCSASMLPAGVGVGQACCVELTGVSPDYSVAAVYEAANADHAAEAAYLQDGSTFVPGRVPVRFGGTP